MQYNPYYNDAPAERPRIRFSRIEVQHLLMAIVGLTAAFAILLAPGDPFDYETRLDSLLSQPLLIVASLLAVSTGFLLHELAHKVVAQRYGHWAEFRASMQNIALSILVVAFFRFLFAAPGAVMISGRVSPKENGVISLVGPGTNFVIAVLTFPFVFVADQTHNLPIVLGTIAWTNGLLAIFNLLPVGPLDGRKVWRWNQVVYVGAAIAAVGLFILLTITFNPLDVWEERVG